MIDGVSEYKYSILVCVNKILFDSLYLIPSPCFMLKFSVKFLGRIWVLSMANMSMGYMPIFCYGKPEFIRADVHIRSIAKLFINSNITNTNFNTF